MKTSQPVIAQYFFFANEKTRDWKIKFRGDIPYHLLTRLYIWPAWLDDGLLVLRDDADSRNPDAAERVRALTTACRAANPAAEVYISTGYDNGDMYKKAAERPERFAASVVAFMRKYGHDGLDMDWENGLVREGLNSLLTALRAAFDEAGAQDGKRYGLTIATWPYVQPAYDFPVMARTLDAINIMSYGRVRDLGSIVDDFTGFPRDKIIGGVDTEVGYPEGGEDSLGPDGTIAQKAEYARRNGLAGMMSWRLDNDYVGGDEVATYKGAAQLHASMTGRLGRS